MVVLSETHAKKTYANGLEHNAEYNRIFWLRKKIIRVFHGPIVIRKTNLAKVLDEPG